MRSPFAYTPRPGPLQAASPGAAVAYLGALTAVAFLYSSPLVLLAAGAAVTIAGLLAGACGAVRAALWMSLTLGLLIVVVNALVVNRGETVLARLGDWPLLGQVDVTAEAIVAGLVIGLRAAVAMVAFAVYSACVDPDRVLRALRPIAGRSALTATLVSRLVPVTATDAGRLRDAAKLRGPGAAEVGKAPLARRLLAGSLDRAVDVAATLELRGYSLEASGTPRTPKHFFAHRAKKGGGVGAPGRASRFDRRFYAAGVLVLAAAIAGKALGADGFHTYPTVQVGLGPVTLALAVLLVLSGSVPWRGSLRGSRSAPVSAPEARLRGPAAAPVPEVRGV
ncbi:MAG TPA: energy-coupling factor transporter transmembrane component T [Solirubrobacterales bacterium]|jgi:energy-coupling factor transport system permease protein